MQNGMHLPCDYCDYRAVCAREQDDPARLLEKQSMKSVLEALETTEEKEVADDGRENME